jgi:glycosyltransferase involved in cell wall biosynthesis
MRVLLIGKYPPCQGGIASKAYWLSRSLDDRGIFFDVVTLVPDRYRVPAPAFPDALRLQVLECDDLPPWFLPGGDLACERLVAAALQMADDGPPALVEANYLAPFGMAALVVARLLGVPLLLRHAGSDLAKLVTWSQSRQALVELLRAADMVVTNPDAAASLPVDIESAKLRVMQRYVPDPFAFTPSTAEPQHLRLLLAAKLNYHWRLKALDTLCQALRLRPDWRLDAVADGTGRESFETEIEEQGLSGYVSRRAFASPDAMPALFAGATAVWAVERKGGIADFSNVVWEAIASGRACLVAAATAEHPDAELLRSSKCLLVVDPERPESVADALDRATSSMSTAEPPAGLKEAYAGYLEDNAALYQLVAERGDVG